MRKLIEIEQKNLIECDNPKCDYAIPNNSKDFNEPTVQYIDMPCPLCGENLLTEKDFIDGEKVRKVLNFMNKWFSWLTIFVSKKKEYKKIGTIKVHEGTHINTTKDKI